MQSLSAALAGVGRALASPKVVLWLWLAQLLVALPAAMVVEESIRGSLGASTMAERLREGFDLGWYGEYEEEAAGLGATLTPSRTGIGGLVENLDLWLGASLFEQPAAVVTVGLLFALLWLLLLGGALEHFARPVPGLGLASFLGGGARCFGPFLRLSLLSAPLYYGIYRLTRILFPWIERRTRDVTVERTVLFWNLVGAAAIALLAVAVKLVFDLARVAVVVERGRSALVALVRGAAFLLSHPLRTFALFGWIGLASLVALVAYAWIAPGIGQASWSAVLGAALVGQAFLVVKGILRLSLVAGELHLYRMPSRRFLPRSR